MRRKKILFVTPPYHCGVVEVAGSWLPAQFVFLADSARKAGLEAHVFDAMGLWKSHEDIVRAMEGLRPDYVAVSTITATIREALAVLENAKRLDPSIITLLGGVHATFMDRRIMRDHPSVDFVVRGEGELTLQELLTCLGRGGDGRGVRGVTRRCGKAAVRERPRPLARDLEALGRAWDLIDWKNYTYHVYPGSRLGIINTSRGCDGLCTFCSQQKFWKRTWRGRGAADVLREIEFLHGRCGVDVLLIGDEYPTSDRRRWEAILDGLIGRRMPVKLLMETKVEDIVRDADILPKYRRAGVVHVYIGVEATDQKTLDLIRKDLRVETSKRAIDLLREHGMISETSFILGFPQETPRTVRATFELSRWYNPDFAHYLALAPWPYADIYRAMRPYITVHDFSKYNLIDPVIRPEEMTLAAVDRAMIECYRDFYMGKMRELPGLDAARRDYLMRSMKLIMRSSFIVKKLGGPREMPRQALAALASLSRRQSRAGAR